MSDNKQPVHDDIPRMEPWLAISLLAFLPAIGLFVLPSAAAVPLYIAMTVLMTAGIGMFLRSEARKAKKGEASTM